MRRSATSSSRRFSAANYPAPDSLHVRASLAFALACALVLASPTARAGDGRIAWRTVETEHFAIHHPGELTRQAERLGLVAEQAWAKITRVLDHRPEFKTDIVLSDFTDDTNGFAITYPYARVLLVSVSPDDRSELNDYDDYLEHVVTHELTHVVHIDTMSGVWRAVNYLLGFGGNGRIFAPNSAQPAFIVEGFAIVEESERTTGGRLRSSLYDMFLRTATLAGRVQRLDQFANQPIQFPRGNSAHFYGAAFLGFVVGRYGDDVLRALAHESGGDWVPGGMNRALRHVIGKTYEDVYREFTDDLGERYRRERDAIAARAGGLTPTLVLTGPRDFAARPTFTPDGKEVVWADSDGYSRVQLRALTVPALSDIERRATAIARPSPGSVATEIAGEFSPRTFALLDGAGAAVFSPDGRTAYLAARNIHETFYYWSDLWALDVASGARRQITEGLRAAEPALSPDGRTLAFDIVEAGGRSLVTMDVAGEHAGQMRRLISNRDDFSQIYTPSWSPDGRTIAFSWWRAGGFRDVWLIDVASGALTQLTADRALDLDPRWSPDGKYLYFSSDRSGVYNLYAWERASGALWQVTNLIGGAFDLAIAPDGRRAVFVGFEADGWRLEALTLDRARWTPAAPSVIDRPPADAPVGIADLPAHDYAPWDSAWPHTWSLQSYPDPFGQALALSLAGQDAVGNHTWSLTIAQGFGRADDQQLAAAYTYDRFFPTLRLHAARALTLRSGLVFGGANHQFTEDDTTLSASVTLPILRRTAYSADLAVGWGLVYLRDIDVSALGGDPAMVAPVYPATGLYSSLSASFSWSSARRYTFSHSNEEGRQVSLDVTAALRAIGSATNVWTASWSWREFVPVRWPFLPQAWRNHVLALSYAGGVSGGDPTLRSVFYLGGYAPQPDPLRAVADFTRPGTASLRGYPYEAISGSQFQVVSAEYRFPISWIERGYATLPLYLQRLHGAVFADFGNATSAPFDARDLRLGIGAELRLEITLGYVLPAALQLGYARGLSTGGVDQIYFLLNNSF